MCGISLLFFGTFLYHSSMKNYEAHDGNVATKTLFTLTMIVLLAAAAYFPYIFQQRKIDSLNGRVSELNTQITSLEAKVSQNDMLSITSTNGATLRVYTPIRGDKVTSPLAVIGQIPGNWSFEGSFPIVLKDSSGAIIAKASATVLGNWMTSQLVPFSAQLTYSTTPTGSGTLTLQKDNPSGLPANDDTAVISVKF